MGTIGETCLPSATCSIDNDCPTDRPPSTGSHTGAARARCGWLVDSKTRANYCALGCGVDEACPDGAICASLLRGVCVYPNSTAVHRVQHGVMSNDVAIAV